MKQFKLIIAACAALMIASEGSQLRAQCTTVPQVNSVINGTFESGYIASGPGSFASDQTYAYDPSNATESAKMDAIFANPAANGPCAWASDGKYYIGSYFPPFQCDGSTRTGHPFLTETDALYDHTKGIGQTGKYLMIDSKNGAVTGLGITLWEQDVNVIAGENYYFSAWFMNFSPASNGSGRVAIRFIIEYFNAGGTSIAVNQLGGLFTPADASRGNNWEQAFRTNIAPPGAVKARLGLYNQTASILVGNDVAIDDISFVNGCQDITGNIPPPPNLGPDLNICATNGTITLNSNVATNVPANRTFSWYSGTGATQTQIGVTNTVSNTINITTPGTYRVCVFEATAGSCAKSSTVVITEAQTIDLGADGTLCQPNSTTVALNSVLANPGATYAYSWTKNGSAYPGTGANNTTSTTGTYVVTATHPTRVACNATDTKVVTSTNTMTTNIGPDVNLCGAPNAVFTSSLTGSAFTYQWQKNGVDISGATSSTYTATIPGTYQLTMTHSLPACNVSDVAVVSNSNPVTANNTDFCAPAAKTVGLSVTGPGTFNWYAASTGGAALATSTPSFTTPAISTTTTYYVQDMTSATGNALPGATPYSQQDYNFYQTMKGSEFTTLKNNVTLNSVDLWVGSYSTVSGLQICLQNTSGTTISSVAAPSMVNSTASAIKFTVTLGLSIPATGTYRLTLCAGTTGSLMGDLNPASVTDASNTITFTQAFTQNSWENKFNYFQNLNFSAGSNPCGRLPVTANMTGSCPAPVTLISFDGVLNDNNAVNLSWITTQEINASHYIVERSYDGKNFLGLGTVAANNISSISNYGYTDLNPGATGIIYYRLAQYDLDGSVHYSNIIAVAINSAELTVYPNPGKGIFNIALSTEQSNTITIEVVNTLGQVVHSESIKVSGQLNKALDLQSVSAGVYYLKVQSGNNGWTERLVKE